MTEKETQANKELLLKDLSARLPYGVKINESTQGDFTVIGLTTERVFTTCETKGCHNDFPIECVKPYLFPLSSLTEEQRNNISKLLIDTQNEFSPYGELNPKGCDNLFVCSTKQANVLINYCLANHLDINGLIEKGLAIDATGLNIY